jgi:hypothetical protein
LFSGFNRNDISNIFHYTNGLFFSGRIIAYRAEFLIGNIVTVLAKLYFPAHPGDSFTELHNGAFFLFEQVKYQSEGSFLAYSRKLSKFFYSRFQQV